MQLLKIVQYLLQACRHQKAAVFGQPSDKEFEHGSFLHVLPVVALQHGQLIEIGQQGAAGNHAIISLSSGMAPLAIMS